jgi:hypothetical protein
MLKTCLLILDRGTIALLNVFLSDPRRSTFVVEVGLESVQQNSQHILALSYSIILPEIGTIRVSRPRLKKGRLLTAGLHETRAWCSVAGSGARSMQTDNCGVWLQKFYIAVED